MTQTWRINGQVYTHAQLMELKAQGLDPHKDEIIMKFVTPTNKGVEADEVVEVVEELEKVEEVKEALSIEEFGLLSAEFNALKEEKVWYGKDEVKKARYKELKKLLV